MFGRWSSFLVRERFNNLEAIKQVRCPTFLLHGKKDSIVPWTHGDELCQSCGGPTMLLLSDTMDHNSFDFMEDLIKPFAQFMDKCDISVLERGDERRVPRVSRKYFIK